MAAHDARRRRERAAQFGTMLLTITTVDDLREIDGASAKIKVQGARYPEELERMTGR